jgi:hypothetical protein
MTEETDRMNRPHRIATLLLALAACGGDSPTGPTEGDERPEALLRILRLAESAPPLFNTEVSFWARRGEGAEVALYFQDPEGKRGDKFVELDLEGESLHSYPDGRPFAEGDSVLITMRALDPAKLMVELQPAGLTFNPLKPAELEFRYHFADDDFNEDGRTDDEDDQIETILGIWRQEVPGEPFVRLGTVRIEELEELDAKLFGFSRLIIAY